MKKFLGLTLIIMFGFLLVGCGNNDDKKDDTVKPVNTDTSTYMKSGYEKLKDTLVAYNDSTKEIYDQKVTVYFKDGKAVNVKVTMTFKDSFKHMIANMKETLSKNTSYQNIAVNGNVITYDYTKAGFETFDEKTKAEVKTELEESNHTFR